MFVLNGAVVSERFVGGGQVELLGVGRRGLLEEASARLERAGRVHRAVGYVEQFVLEYFGMVGGVFVEVRVERVRVRVVGVGVGAQAAVRRVFVEVGLGETVAKAVGQLFGGVGQRKGQVVAQPQSFHLLVDA